MRAPRRGQPADRGRIVAADGGAFAFTDVRSDRATGVIQHLGDPADATRCACVNRRHRRRALSSSWVPRFASRVVGRRDRFAAGTPVTVHVDEAARRLHARCVGSRMLCLRARSWRLTSSGARAHTRALARLTRLHSAGHLLDAALANIGVLKRLNLKPGKGYHFPNGPYVGAHERDRVHRIGPRDSPTRDGDGAKEGGGARGRTEYIGVIPDAERDAIQAMLQAEMDRLIQNNSGVEVHLNVSPERLGELCDADDAPAAPTDGAPAKASQGAVPVRLGRCWVLASFPSLSVWAHSPVGGLRGAVRRARGADGRPRLSVRRHPRAAAGRPGQGDGHQDQEHAQEERDQSILHHRLGRR